LVLGGGITVYFTNSELSSIGSKLLPNSLEIMKSTSPDDGELYFKYFNLDALGMIQ